MRGKNREKGFISWFPKVSAIAFVFSLFAFLATDTAKLLDSYPLLFNFFFGVLILAILVIWWNRNRFIGVSFICLGLIYGLVTWDEMLLVSSISTSFWLLLTGLLFLVSGEEEIKPKKFSAKKVRRE